MSIFSVLLLVISILLIVVIVIQPSKGEGLGSIGGGGGQLFFGKNKGLEQFLERLTTGLAIAFFLVAIIANLF
ncbi:MAG: preprotein translocase subunit SecG [Firmicutes bacterium]|nr:preprotein translocase subunit SecG [Bacillota bacterium]